MLNTGFTDFMRTPRFVLIRNKHDTSCKLNHNSEKYDTIAFVTIVAIFVNLSLNAFIDM